MAKMAKEVKTEKLSAAQQKQIKQTVTDFFTKLGFEVKPDINFDSPFFSDRLCKVEEGGIAISIPGADLGILIGFRGETLQSLQTVLNVIIKRKLKDTSRETLSWNYVNLDIAGWKQNREEVLVNIAQKAIDEVRKSKTSITLPSMTPSERRIVHIFLTTVDGVDNRSEGEEPNRRIVIEAKG